jgi:hypothetical protein
MYRVSLRSIAAHKARLALSTRAVVLGVTFIAGTLVFSDTINTGFTTLFTATAPDVTVTPRMAFTPEVAAPPVPTPIHRSSLTAPQDDSIITREGEVAEVGGVLEAIEDNEGDARMQLAAIRELRQR